MHLTGSTTICVRLIAIGSIIMEALIVRAVLPAHRADSAVVTFTEGITERTILILVLRASREGFTCRAARCFFPARVRHIGVVVIVVIVVDRGAIIVLLGVSERLL